MENQIRITIAFMFFSGIFIGMDFVTITDKDNFSKINYGNHSFYQLNILTEIIFTFFISLGYLFIIIPLNFHHTFNYLFLFLYESILTIMSFFSCSIVNKLLTYIMFYTDKSNNKIHYYKLLLNGDISRYQHYVRMDSDDKKYFIDDSLFGVKMNDKFEMEIIEKINNQEIPALFNLDYKIIKGRSKGINIRDYRNVKLELIEKINSQIRLLKEHIDKKKKIAFDNDSNLKEIKEFVHKL